MKPGEHRDCELWKRRRRGSALLITMLVLLLVSLLAVTGLERSGEESTSGARLRSSLRTLHVADSGLQLILGRLTQSPPDLSAFDVALAGDARVASKKRSDPTPMDIKQVGIGTPVEGYSLNIGTGVISVTSVYKINTTGTAGGSTVELEAKLSRSAVDASGY